MQQPPVTNYPLGQAQPDDAKFAWGGTARRLVESLLARGWPVPARFTKSLRVGSGTHTAFDGSDGAIIADGTAAALRTYDVTGGNNYVQLNRNATQFFLSTPEGALLTFDATTGILAQPALTTLSAGTSITLGITNFATQGSRVVAATGEIYAVIHLTATGTIAAGATVATLAAGHRPAAKIRVGATKFTGGVLTTPVAATLVIDSAGLVVTETALASTDTLACIARFMLV